MRAYKKLFQKIFAQKFLMSTLNSLCKLNYLSV